MTTEDLVTIYRVVMVVMAVLIVLSNSLVLVAIIKTKHLHVPTNIFVAGMAIADLSMGLIGVPLKILDTTELKFSFDTCLFINLVPLMLTYMSIFMILGLAFDRLFAIRYPFQYQRHFTCCQAISAVALLYILGSSLVLVPEWFMDLNQREEYKGNCYFIAVISPWFLFYFGFVGLFVIPVTIIMVVNIYIFRVVKAHKRKIRSLSVAIRDSVKDGKCGSIHEDIKYLKISLKKLKRLKKEHGSVFILIAMAAAFFFCMLPINIVDVIWFVSGSLPKQNAEQLMVSKVLYYCMSPLLDPIIYGLCHSKIRKALKNVLTREHAFDGLPPSSTKRSSKVPSRF